ncbi:hypothetical protein P691DRAFT_812700 [Macrolepiota fuliginosa MF-IS2]|uniref:Transmembrane protein n=1 Tax=Macrolepiota fuliginosa MF-IS2 TaxID=1400762 RepID=A0A9P5XE42_9AGAR|nr:hypothetical protein P691DRAFT_812700 [Macrolepiota fuliginosa MF-IS2]
MMTWSLSRVTGVGLAVAAMVDGGVGRLEARAFNGPTCDTTQDWLWMDNRQQKSPCLTAAYLQGTCIGKDFSLAPLASNQKYDPPSVALANPCYCSWAVYNLYSACALCQGAQNGISSWASWNNSCAGNSSSTVPYPPNFPIADNTTFPNWAAVNPTTWTDGRWDLVQAQNISITKPGDWVAASAASPSSTPGPKSSNNVGPIVGGVVGGVLALAIGVAIALFVYCRSQRRRAQRNHLSQVTQVPLDQHHMRSPSDMSAKTFGSGFPYTSLQHTAPTSSGSISRPVHSPTTFHTHNPSIGSMTHESLLALGSTGYPVTPPPASMQALPNVYHTPQGAVSPFTLEHSNENASSHDRKRSDSSTHAGDASGSSAAQGRSPMNPPAYSEAPHGHGDFSSQAPDQASTYGSASIVTTPTSTPHRRPHEKSPSVGSGGSESSATSAGYWTHTQSASLSGVLSQMGSVNLPGPSAAIPPGYAGPGPSTTAQPRDEKRRPTIMNPTTADRENHDPPRQE